MARTVDPTGPDGVARTIDQGERRPGLYKFAFAGGSRSNRAGSAEPEGRYRWSITAVDAEGRRSTAERSFGLNNTLGYVTTRPGIVRVRKKGGGRLVIGFQLTRPAQVTVAITSRTANRSQNRRARASASGVPSAGLSMRS